MARELWPTSRAAQHCGCSPRTFRDYTRRNGAPKPLPDRRDGNGELLFRAEEVTAWHAGRPSQLDPQRYARTRA